MVALNSEGVERPLAEFRDKPALAFCGIGNPDAFRRTLAELGFSSTDFRAFPDHHPYTRAEVESLEQWCEQLPPDGVVWTTQKDLVKLRISRLGGRELWAVRVGLAFHEGEDRLHQLLNQIVAE
jgi:tetraacyldisaccharide 4'-kinase